MTIHSCHDTSYSNPKSPINYKENELIILSIKPSKNLIGILVKELVK